MNQEPHYFPDPCNAPGHIAGCAGLAGGAHEMKFVDLTTARLSDDIRLEVGKLVFDRFFDQYPRKMEATSWLRIIGFDSVEWVTNDEGDVMFLCLWRFSRTIPQLAIDEFILEFSGHDAANISLFNLVKEVSL